jgi:tetratricopeptide (TPR) repeat protein
MSGDLMLKGKAINSKGVAYYHLNDISQSNALFFQALTLFDSAGNQPGVAKALNNIGWNLKLKNDYDQAITYFSNALTLAQQENDHHLSQAILNNMGTVYKAMNQLDKAIEVYYQSLELNKAAGNKQWEAYNLNNIGVAYMEKGELSTAREALMHAHDINMKENFLEESVKNKLNLGKLYFLDRKYDLANAYFAVADSVISVNDFQRSRLDYLAYSMEMNEMQGKYNTALHYQREYTTLNEKLNQIAWNEKISELQTRYEVSERVRELDKSERKVREQKAIIYGGMAFFVLLISILMLVFVLYKSKHSYAQKIEKLNQKIRKEAIELEGVNRKVKEMNDNLEKIIENRTKKLNAQNEKLIRYAFINSHNIRGPLARILGLTYLLSLDKSQLSDCELLDRLTNSAQELDFVIKSASKILEEEELIDASPLETEQ